MAGDWIKVRKELPTDPAVLAMADELGVSENEVIGRLIRIWSWCDSHVTDGCARGATIAQLGRALSCEQTLRAMEKVGWLSEDKRGVFFPNHDRHLAQGAKARGLATERMRKSRCARSATKAQPEKRREEKILDIPNGISYVVPKTVKKFDPLSVQFPSELDCEPFRLAWAEWVRHRQEIGASLKATGATRQLKQLASWGVTGAIEAIEASVRNGWRGLFDPKAKGMANHGGGRKQEPGSIFDADAKPDWD